MDRGGATRGVGPMKWQGTGLGTDRWEVHQMARVFSKILIALAVAGSALFTLAGGAYADPLLPPLPVPLPTEPAPSSASAVDPNVSPSVQATVCGNGVGVLGTGTTADCSTSEQSSTAFSAPGGL